MKIKKEEVIYIPSQEDVFETEKEDSEEIVIENSNNIKLDDIDDEVYENEISINGTSYDQILDNIKEPPPRISQEEICDPECSKLTVWIMDIVFYFNSFIIKYDKCGCRLY